MTIRYPMCSACEICDELKANEQAFVVSKRTAATALVPRRVRVLGSLIVTTNRHVMAFNELNATEVDDIALLTWKMSAQVSDKLEAAGLNMWWPTGVLAGQTVPHFVVEIVPRYSDVPYKYVDLSEVPQWPSEQRLQIAQRLRSTSNK